MSLVGIASRTILVVGILFSVSAMAVSIQDDIDTNPRLKSAGIGARVLENKNGYVTVELTGISRAMAQAVQNGRAMAEVAMFVDGAARHLLEMEEILKKRQDVKLVQWTVSAKYIAELEAQAQRAEAQAQRAEAQRREAAAKAEADRQRALNEQAAAEKRRLAAIRKPRLVVAPVGRWSEEVIYHRNLCSAWSTEVAADEVDYQWRDENGRWREQGDREGRQQNLSGWRFRSKLEKPTNVIVQVGAQLYEKCIPSKDLPNFYKSQIGQ